MRVLVIQYADRAVGHSTYERHSIGIAVVTVKPFSRAHYVGQRRAILAIRIEAGSVRDDQSFVRTDRACRR